MAHPIYAGYITHEGWELHLVKGKHEGLISLETWKRNQDKFLGRTKQDCNAIAPTRKDTRPDFPLRGFVTCCGCDNPLTAAWAKGRSARYGYYFCQTKECTEYRKNIRKIDMEGDFEALLHQMTPDRPLFELAHDILKDQWEGKRHRFTETRKKIKANIIQLETKAESLIKRLLGTEEASLIKVYETQLKRLEENKLVLMEKADKYRQPLATFEETYRTACEFLANPCNLWTSPNWQDRRILLRLAFAGRIPYCTKTGYRTAIPALPFNVLREISDSKSGMVGPEGLEPPTRPL